MNHRDEIDAMSYATAALKGLSAGLRQVNQSASEAAAALAHHAMAGISTEEILRRLAAKESNNWRKMHGKPMRRERGRRRGRSK